jgi:hypothetical protein
MILARPLQAARDGFGEDRSAEDPSSHVRPARPDPVDSVRGSRSELRPRTPREQGPTGHAGALPSAGLQGLPLGDALASVARMRARTPHHADDVPPGGSYRSTIAIPAGR